MSAALEHIWPRVQDELESSVGATAYSIWLAQLRALELDSEHLLVEAPPHALPWIRDRFGRVLAHATTAVCGEHVHLQLVPSAEDDAARDGQDPQRLVPGSSAGRARGPRAPAAPAARPQRTPESGPLGNPKLTFGQFVIGDSNRLAHAAALTVAEMPGHAYNPLFICGPPGVGKTHLLSSIANLIVMHDPCLAVRLTTAEAFTTEFLAALGSGTTEAFKDRFRCVDVLLLDDVQFLERKTRTEEEFFHTFNALHDGDRQIVLTSDRPPRDLQALEDRLRERFQSGLVADVQPPDVATRLAILRKRVHHDAIVLDDERPLQLIAERVTSNVRALEGALIRVVAFSSLTGRPLTQDLALDVLDGLYPPAPGRGPSTVADIQAAACEHFSVSSSELISSTRTARVSWARQVAMYLARELTEASLPAIGREFGGRDHSTVLHACRRAKQRVASDPDARNAVERLRSALLAGDQPRAGSPPDRRA